MAVWLNCYPRSFLFVRNRIFRLLTPEIQHMIFRAPKGKKMRACRPFLGIWQ